MPYIFSRGMQSIAQKRTGSGFSVRKVLQPTVRRWPSDAEQKKAGARKAPAVQLVVCPDKNQN
jgi:hypothetical protein